MRAQVLFVCLRIPSAFGPGRQQLPWCRYPTGVILLCADATEDITAPGVGVLALGNRDARESGTFLDIRPHNVFRLNCTTVDQEL